MKKQEYSGWGCAIDAQHVLVTFNNAVLAGSDVNSAETAANYAITGETVSSAKLGTDGKSVTLTTSAALTNNTAYTVTVLKNVEDANAVALSAKTNYTTGLFFSDTTAPTIASVAGQPNGDIEITFSERVAAATPTIVINGQTVSPNSVVDNTVTVTKANLALANANLTSGKSYSVVVSGYTDLASNALSLYNGTFTYNVVADTTVPAVTSLVANDEKTLTLTFSKAIKGVTTDGSTDNAAILGLGVTKGTAATSITTTATTTDGKVFTLNLDTTANKVYDGTATPAETSASLAVTVSGYEDSSLNVGQKYTQNVTVTKDATLPTLTKSVYDATNAQFVFTFSKALTAESAAALAGKGISVVDSNGVAQTALGTGDFVAIGAGDKTLTIKPGTAYAAGTYTFTFAFAKGTVNDNSLNGGNQNAQFSTTVATAVADVTAPTISTVASGSKDHLAVTFDEAVKGGSVTGSATDASNYKLNGVALPANTVITLNAGKTIASIALPTGSVSTTQTYVLTTSNVQDLAGNVLTTIDNTVALTDSVAPVLQSAAYDATTGNIVLTFSENFATATAVNSGDLIVKDNGVTISDAAIATPVTGDKANQVRISSVGTSFATGTITISTASGTRTGADAAANTLTPDTTISLAR